MTVSGRRDLEKHAREKRKLWVCGLTEHERYHAPVCIVFDVGSSSISSLLALRFNVGSSRDRSDETGTALLKAPDCLRDMAGS